MPRKVHIDSPGALHNIIIRGMECKAIISDTADLEQLRGHPIIPPVNRKSEFFYIHLYQHDNALAISGRNGPSIFFN